MKIFPVFKNFLSKFWGNVGLSFISKFLNKSKFFGEILERKMTKNFLDKCRKNFLGGDFWVFKNKVFISKSLSQTTLFWVNLGCSRSQKNFFANEKNFFNKFWANVGLSFISKCLNKSKFSGEILDNKKGVTKNFCQTSSGNFSALFWKFVPENLDLMGIIGSVAINKN